MMSWPLSKWDSHMCGDVSKGKGQSMSRAKIERTGDYRIRKLVGFDH